MIRRKIRSPNDEIRREWDSIPVSNDKENDVGSDVPRSQESKRQNSFPTIVKDAIREDSLREFVTQLEPFLRSAVREEVESAVERAVVRPYHSSSRTSLNQSKSSQARVWQLHFVDKLPSSLFTGSRIESEDGNSVNVVILDTVSRKVISSGPFSSLKVQIVVLDGDFGADDKEDWTEEEFNENLVCEREGKRPLVTGDLVITLTDGVGSIGNVSFTDNSSWIRSRKFRLGARPVQSTSTEVRIREARSEAFAVKDHHGELYKKHHPPKLNDEIWRLEKIAKGGTCEKALAGYKITTVKDFLRSYYVDPSFLRRVLAGISIKTWQTIIEHATACVLDDELYAYYKDGENIGIVFNSVYKVVGVTFDGGQSYQFPDMLNEFRTGLVENLKRHAYKNLDALVPCPIPQISSSNLQDANFPGMHQAYEKHHPPKLNDEIWRSEKIAKGGAFEKADDALYAYYKDGESIGSVLNSIHRVEGVTFDGGQSYHSEQKPLVDFDATKNRAYQSSLLVSPKKTNTIEAYKGRRETLIRRKGKYMGEDNSYYEDGESIGSVLNSIHRVEGVTFDGGQSYHSEQKPLVDFDATENRAYQSSLLVSPKKTNTIEAYKGRRETLIRRKEKYMGEGLNEECLIKSALSLDDSTEQNSVVPRWGRGHLHSTEHEQPVTFAELGTDPENEGIVSDLSRFVRGREFYKRVGKAWKRGYLLYDPPCTDRSSLMAYMAKCLEFEIYNLDLTGLSSIEELTNVLVSIRNRSLIAIKDFDNWVGMLPNLKNELTFSGLLEIIHGLLSSCGDERIIILTTNQNHIDGVDAALLHPLNIDLYINTSSPHPIAIPDGGDIVQVHSSERKPSVDFDVTNNRACQSDVLVSNSEEKSTREASRRQCMPESVLSLVDSTVRISSMDFDAPDNSAHLVRAYQSGPIVFNSEKKDPGEGVNRECLSKSVLSLDDSIQQKSLPDVDATKNKAHLVRAYQKGLVVSLPTNKNKREALKRECITKTILGLEDFQQQSGGRRDDAAKNFCAIYGPGIHTIDFLAQKSFKVLEPFPSRKQPNDCVPLLSMGRLTLEGCVQDEKSPDLPRVLQMNRVEQRVTKLTTYLGGLTAQFASSSCWPISLPYGTHIVALDPVEQSTQNVALAAREDQFSPTMSLPEKKMVRKGLKRKSRTKSVLFEIHQQHFGRRCEGAAKSFRATRICRKHGVHHLSPVKHIHKQHGIHQWPFRQKWATRKEYHGGNERPFKLSSLSIDEKLDPRLQFFHMSQFSRSSPWPLALLDGGEIVGPTALSSSEFATTNNIAHLVGQDQSGSTASHYERISTRETSDEQGLTMSLFSVEDFQHHLGCKHKDAVKRLGVSVPMFKSTCRQHCVYWWPRRFEYIDSLAWKSFKVLDNLPLGEQFNRIRHLARRRTLTHKHCVRLQKSQDLPRSLVRDCSGELAAQCSKSKNEGSRRQCIPESVLSLVDSTTRISSTDFDALNKSAHAYQNVPGFNSEKNDSGEGLNREFLTKSVLSLDDSSRPKSLPDVDATKNKAHLVRAYQKGLVVTLSENKNRGEALKRDCISKSILGLEDLQQHSGGRRDDAAKNFGAINDPGIRTTDSLARKSFKVVETFLTWEQSNNYVPLLSSGILTLEGWEQEEKSPNLPRVLQINVVEQRATKLPIRLEGLTAESASSSRWLIGLPDGRHIVVLDPLEQSTKNVARATRVDLCSPTVSLPQKKMVRKTLKRKCRTTRVIFEIHQQHFGRRCEGSAKSFRATRIGRNHGTNRVSTVKRIHKQHGIHQWPLRQNWVTLKGYSLGDERPVDVIRLSMDGKLVSRLQLIHISWLGRFSPRPPALPPGGEIVGPPLALLSSQLPSASNRTQLGGQVRSGSTASHSQNERTRDQPEGRTGKIKNLTLEDLRSHVGLKRADAAKELQISETTFKRYCRELGIVRWPILPTGEEVWKPPDPHDRNTRQIEMVNEVVCHLPKPIEVWRPHNPHERNTGQTEMENEMAGHRHESIEVLQEVFDGPILLSKENGSTETSETPTVWDSMDFLSQIVLEQTEEERGSLERVFRVTHEPTLSTGCPNPNSNPDVFLQPQAASYMGIPNDQRNSLALPAETRLVGPGSASTSQETSFVTLKVYGSEIIKFQLPLTSGINELKGEVAMRLNLEQDSFNMKYEDEEGDKILIPIDKDLRNYLSSSVNPVIKLWVFNKVANPMNLCESCGGSLK